MKGKGSGGYYIRNNKIYVYGTINKKRHRFSIGKEATPNNVRWIKKNYWNVLLNKIETNQNNIDFETLLLDTIELTKYKRDFVAHKYYISCAKRLIIPYFKKYKPNDIKPIDIEKWQNKMLEKYSTSTTSKLKSLINMSLEKAHQNDVITKNPTKIADKFIIKYEPQEVYSIDEINAILNTATGWVKIFFSLAFMTGLRPGELLGLKWEDINFEKKLIIVQRSITNNKIKSSSKTKNHNRVVILPQVVLDLLQDYDSKSEWLFVSRNKSFFKNSLSVTKTYFKPLLKKAKVKYKTLYSTRHTYISLLRNSGISRDFVSELAGHSEQVNDKFYYHSEITEEKMKSINDVFFNLNKAQYKTQPKKE